MSLSSKVFRSSTLNLVEHFVQLAVVFFVTPLMVRQLGETQYGVWLVSMAIVGYYKLLDMGITHAGTRFLAQSIGASDTQDYQINTSTLLVIYRRIGLLAIPLCILVSLIAPLFIKNDNFSGSIRWILLAFGFNISIRFFTRIFPVILRSHVRYDLIVASSLCKTLIQGGLVIYYLLDGAGLTTLIVIHIAADLIDQVLLVFFSRKIDSTVKLNAQSYQSERAKEIVRYGFTASLAAAGNSLRTGIDPLVIGSVNGLARVPVFSIGTRFLQVFIDIVNAVFGGHLTAALSQVEARDGTNSVRDNFLRMIHFSSAFAMLGGCALAIYAPPLIERWIGPDFKDSGTVLLILLPPYVIMLAQYPVWGLFLSTGKQRYMAQLGFGGGVFNLILSLILAYKIGFFGVVWGTFTELSIVYLFILPVMTARSISTQVHHYLFALLPGLLKAGLPSLIWYLLVKNLLQADYLRLLLLASGHALIVFPILWLTILQAKERQQILSMFRRFS